MVSRSFRSLLVAGTVFFLTLSARAQNNPAYDAWAKLKPGSSVMTKTLSEAAGQKSEIHTTTTLSQVTPDKVVLETKMTMVVGGNKMDVPGQKVEIPAKGATAPTPGTPPTTPPPGVDAKTTTETVTIGGKDYKCTVVEANTDANGTKVHSKTWTCPDVPGQLVKMEASSEGAMASKTTIELESVDLK